MRKILVIAAAIISLGGLSVLMNSCQTKQSGVRLVAGTLDAPLTADTAPQHVQEAYGKALKAPVRHPERRGQQHQRLWNRRGRYDVN